jgi:hypothetical protein
MPLDELNPNVPRELAGAVAFALALDQERRPADTAAFAEALRNGLHGIEPPREALPAAALGTGATRVLSGRDSPTGATRVAARPRPAPAPEPGTRPVRRLEPRPYQREPYDGAGEYPPQRARRRGRGVRRALLGLFVGLLFAAGVAVALIVANSTSSGIVHFRTTFSHDVGQAINQFSNLISQATK